jgi:protein ImuA
MAGPALRLLAGEATIGAAPLRELSSELPFDTDFSRTIAALGGAAALSRLHALHPARPGDEGAVAGFACTVLGVLGRAAVGGNVAIRTGARPILWVQERSAAFEAGRPYGPGLEAFGLHPSQLVLVMAKGALEALAAVEIGLEIGGLAGVLAELPSHLPADMLALGKRLALRAERSATPCLLLHASAHFIPAPVATRWQIASLPAVPDRPWGVPVARADLALVKNRFGATGRWSVPLAAPSPSLGVAFDGQSARLSTPFSEPLAAPVADRSPAQAFRAA